MEELCQGDANEDFRAELPKACSERRKAHTADRPQLRAEAEDLAC